MADATQGILLIDKPVGISSFSLVRVLRKKLGVKKIGHAGTLDPFASGVMVMLVGRSFTRLSDTFLNCDKEYEVTIQLGVATDTYDCEGKVVSQSHLQPSEETLTSTIDAHFQGQVLQTPPMFSAKKINGKKLYELARKGQEVERRPVQITLQTKLVKYCYPFIELKIRCSKGTYVRSVAHDLGQLLGCGAHATKLRRTRSGKYHIEDCITNDLLQSSDIQLEAYLKHSVCM